jgi:adenylate cyclase
MKASRNAPSGWRVLVERIPVRYADLLLALLMTTAGLVLFAYVDIGASPRAGFSFLKTIELRSLDLRFAVRGRRAHDEHIVIVGIDERTLQKLGAFPVPRGAYAELLDRLHAGGARVIGFDETFPTPQTNAALDVLRELQRDPRSAGLQSRLHELEAASDQDARFAAAVKRCGNVVLGHLFLDQERARGSDPKLAQDYYNVVWAHAIPQVLKLKHQGRDFALGQAWTGAQGMVAYGVEANIPALAEAAQSFGYFNNNPDPDGTLRRAVLVMRYQDQDFFPSLALEIYRAYQNIADQDVAAYISENGLESVQLGARRLSTGRDGTVLINYAGPYHTYRHYSMADVISGATAPDAFDGKIVLVGGTALGIGDLRTTPFQKQDNAYMGVEVHANILDNLLHLDEPGRGFLVRGFREEMADIAVILIFGLGLGSWFGRTKPLVATATVLAALGGFSVLVYLAFARYGSWLSFVIPSATLVATYASVTSFRMIFEEREKRRIRKTFSQYLSPGVISLMEKQPSKYFRAGGETKELTVMFSDVRNFTSLSEGLSPDELVQWLNEYLGAMTDILFETQGTLDKYIGDAVMGFWGSPYPQPEHAANACRCALQMQEQLAWLNSKWRAAGRKTMQIGIGINTGQVNVGNMGSERRFSWTVMGDNVNLASRLEGLTKEYGVGIVISEATYQQVCNDYLCRDLDRIRVKGKNVAVGVYELMGSASQYSEHAALLRGFADALQCYREQQWGEAVAGFERLAREFPQDGPSKLFLGRSRQLLANCPGSWDGVFAMKTK